MEAIFLREMQLQREHYSFKPTVLCNRVAGKGLLHRIERVRSLMIDRRAKDVRLELLGNRVYGGFRELRKL